MRVCLRLAGDGGASTALDGATIPLRPLLAGPLLLGTLPHGLRAPAPQPGLLLLRLWRDGDALAGAGVAQVTLERLEHLLPYRLALRHGERGATGE